MEPRFLFVLLASALLAGCPEVDADGDGAPASEDCDDTNAAVFPGAAEVCDNGIDENCDEVAPECRRVGAITLGSQFGGWAGPGPDALFGAAIDRAGDVDGDGYEDVVVGAPGDDRVATDAGSATLLFGGADGLDPTRSLTVFGAFGGDRVGQAVAGGWDVTGDGALDLVLGAPGNGTRDAPFTQQGTGLASGSAYIVPGPFGLGPDDGGEGHAAWSVADGFGAVRGGESTDCVGRALDVADADGDGVGDLLVSAMCSGSSFLVHPHGNLPMVVDGPGAAAWFRGPVGEAAFGAGVAVVRGDEEWDRLGAAAVFGPDVDGDGVRDVVLGAPDYYGADWINIEATGRALVFSGAATGALTAADALWVGSGGCCGATRHDALATSISVGDLDGDGDADLLIGAPRLQDFGVDGGAFALVGPLSGSVDVPSAARWVASPPGEDASAAGTAVQAGFDLDCDGVQDVAVGAPDDGGVLPRGGAVRIHYGPVGDFVTLGQAAGDSMRVDPAYETEQLGRAMAAVDVDGDGCRDLVVGAPEARVGGVRSGAVRWLPSTGF